MRWFPVLGATLLAACATPEVQTQKLNDGSIQVVCQLAMDECVRRVQDQCRNQRYRILEGTAETRLRDAPPFEKAYHTSKLHLTCTNDGGEPLIGGGDKPAVVPAASATAAKQAPTCTQGETRMCVGAGACKGGQACLPDGKGFGACDCGPVAPPAAPDPAVPSGASEPAPTAPSPSPAP